MIRAPMRVLTLLLTAFLAACATAPRAAVPSLEGSWQWTTINGRPLPAESPSEPGVMVQRGSLAVEPAGRYTLSVGAHVGPQATPVEMSLGGAYTVAGDQLTFTPDSGADARPVTYRYTLNGGVLRLTDEKGVVFDFARR